jgi:hypothetical protein
MNWNEDIPAQQRKHPWSTVDLTAEELNGQPNFQSGLPTNPHARAEALEAYRRGGALALNIWQVETSRKRGGSHG